MRDLEIYNTRHVAKGPSIIDVDYEGEGGGVHYSKRHVDYIKLIGGPWGGQKLGK